MFYPNRMADRILGMGDVVSLVERAQEQYDEEEARKLQKKIAKNEFGFDISDDLHWKSWKNHTLRHLQERVKTYAEEKFAFKIIEVDLEV